MATNRTDQTTVMGSRYRAKHAGFVILALVCLALAIATLFYNFGWASRSQQVSAQYVQPDQSVADVLLVMSYDDSDTNTPLARNGVLDIMGRSSVGVDVVYMDAHNSPYGSSSYDAWVSQIAQKASQHGAYNAVICVDDEALYFIEDNHDSMFASTPVVFFGINDFNHALHATSSGYMTGMVEQSYYGSIMQATMDLHPDATTFLAVVDDTPTGVGDKAQFDLAMQNFDDINVRYVNASALTRNQLASAVSAANDKTIVFLLDANNDLYGNVYSLDDTASFISSASNYPVYRGSMGGVGSGLAGSGYLDPEADGRAAAEMTIDILNGTRPVDLPLVLEGNPGYVFDAQVLNNYGLSSANLPQGSTVINRNVFSLDTLKLLVLPIALLIVALFFLRAARRAKLQFAYSEGSVKSIANYQVDGTSARSLEHSEAKMQLVANNKQQDEMDQADSAAENSSNDASETHGSNSKSNAKATGTRRHDDKRAPRNKDKKPHESSGASDSSGEKEAKSRESRTFKRRHVEPQALIGIDIVNFSDIENDYGSKMAEDSLNVIRKRLDGVENATFIKERKEGFLVGIENELARGSQEVEFVEFVLHQPLTVDDVSVSPETCVCVVNRKSGLTTDDMISEIEFALDQSRELGCVDNVVFYDNNMRCAMEDRAEITELLKHSIAMEDFLVFYQPQVNLNNNDVSGYEALVRLKDKKYPPAQFIPVAEMTGLIVDIDRIVTKRAVEQLSKWKRRNKRMRPISINLSAAHLTRDDDYVDYLLQVLETYEVPAGYIRIEITEALFKTDQKRAEELITRLFQSGITIALDRFGMGFTSFSDIMTIPASVVKIDKEFVDTFLVDGNDNNFEQLVLLAQGFGKRVVVVGVDKKWQLEVCRKLNCDAVQGYYFSKPLLPENAVQFKPR